MSKLGKMLTLIKGLSLVATNSEKWGPFVECFNETRFDHTFSVSWSQCGEDLLLDAFLPKKNYGFYLDIGAHHPSRFSVTRRLYQRGWSGVNVDANSMLESEFRTRRPRDVFIAAAVGEKENYELFLGDELAVSTVNQDWMSEMQSRGMIYNKRKSVPGLSLREIFNLEICPMQIDFLNVDIEGADLEALSSARFETLEPKRWPRFIMVESSISTKSLKSNPSVSYLLEIGYELKLQLPFTSLVGLPNTQDVQEKAP